MQCDEKYLSLLSCHIDGTNSEAEEAELQEHLSSCSHCRELLTQLEEADTLLAESTVPPPADLSFRIMEAVRKEPKQSKKRRAFYFSTAAAGLAAAALLCFAFLGDSLPPLVPTADSALEKNTAAEYAEDQEETITETGPVLAAPVPSDYSLDAESAEVQDGTEGSNSSTVTASSQTEYPLELEVSETVTLFLPSFGDSKGTFSYGSSLPLNRNGTAVDSIPTLVIWDAPIQEIPLLKNAAIVNGEDDTFSADEEATFQAEAPNLYEWLSSVEPEELAKVFPRKPSLELTVYTMDYSLFCQLVEFCAGEFEIALYYPEDLTGEGSCQVLIFQQAEE